MRTWPRIIFRIFSLTLYDVTAHSFRMGTTSSPCPEHRIPLMFLKDEGQAGQDGFGYENTQASSESQQDPMKTALGLPPRRPPSLPANVRKLSGQAAQPLGSHREALPDPETKTRSREREILSHSKLKILVSSLSPSCTQPRAQVSLGEP